MKKNNKTGKINEYNILGINIQIILTLIVCIFAIVALFFSKKFFPFLEITAGLDLLIMAFNNERVYHSHKATILYMIVGIIILVIGILSIVGVI